MNMVTSILLFVLIFVPFVLGIVFLVLSLRKTNGDYSRRKTLTVAGIVILCVVLIFVVNGLLHGPILLKQVEKMELYAYDHVSCGHVELTQAEQWMIAFLYNLSWRGGEVTGEPCCAAYGVDIYLNDGSEMSISEGVFSKMIVDLPGMYAKDRFYANCPLLVGYIYVLAEKYDLPIE